MHKGCWHRKLTLGCKAQRTPTAVATQQPLYRHRSRLALVLRELGAELAPLLLALHVPTPARLHPHSRLHRRRHEEHRYPTLVNAARPPRRANASDTARTITRAAVAVAVATTAAAAATAAAITRAATAAAARGRPVGLRRGRARGRGWRGLAPVHSQYAGLGLVELAIAQHALLPQQEQLPQFTHQPAAKPTKADITVATTAVLLAGRGRRRGQRRWLQRGREGDLHGDELPR